MQIDDFAWRQGNRPLIKPSRPFVTLAFPGHVPKYGAVHILVDATICNLKDGEDISPRRFTFALTVDAAERDAYGGWREDLRAWLVDECLTRWNE